RGCAVRGGGALPRRGRSLLVVPFTRGAVFPARRRGGFVALGVAPRRPAPRPAVPKAHTYAAPFPVGATSQSRSSTASGSRDFCCQPYSVPRSHYIGDQRRSRGSTSTCLYGLISAVSPSGMSRNSRT